MDLKKSKRLLAILAVVYWVFVGGIYAIANEQFRYASVTGDAPTAGYVIGEIIDGQKLCQPIGAPAEVLTGVDIYTATYDRSNLGTLTVSVADSQGNILGEKIVDISSVRNNQYTNVLFDEPVAVTNGEMLTLQFTTDGCAEGNAITIYGGTLIKGNAVTQEYSVNGVKMVGGLCVRLNGFDELDFYKTYWAIVTVAFVALCAFSAYWWKDALKGHANPLVSLMTVYSRYSFLIKQLVSRDFKTKYKRSSLGMAWSFMNPLLTMLVQYVVFSALFKSDIPNYPVYLLTGIVFFSFFNESVSLGMTSITSNAALIKKVYMPKYIYPVSRIFSSLINFGFALVPLFLVMIITGTPFRVSMLLMIFDIICLLVFVIGMTLLLSTAMTFFQDTQFLWGIGIMLWQYLTPIFYPDTIIPEKFLPFYRLNPMYQYISFARICISDGISPPPEAYFRCMFTASIFLLLGIFVFKKNQNKFAMYL